MQLSSRLRAPIRNDYDGDSVLHDQADTFTLTEYDSGAVFVFAGFNSDLDSNVHGRLIKRTNRGVDETIRYYYHTSGNEAGFVSSITTGQGWSIDYDYYTNDSGDPEDNINSGRLQKIEVKNGSGDGGTEG